MKLSNVPFSELRSDAGWLTGANGAPGRIVAINTTSDGNSFKTYLHIVWENGTESYPDWPHECNNVTVDETYQHVICKPYMDHHVGILKENIDYLIRHSSGK